jgi:hypothetical protein
MFAPPPPGEYKPLTPGERVGYGLLVLIIYGLFAAEVITNFEPVKLAVLLFFAFWPLLLVLHEGGHALTAAILGWRIRRIVIGVGRVVTRFRIGRTPVEMRIAPVVGFVVPLPTSLHLVRLKSALVYFAGPGIELLLVLVLLAIVGPERMLTRTDDYWIIAVQSLALAAMVGAVTNLVPLPMMSQNGMVASDGLGIMRSFTLPNEYFAAIMANDKDDGDEFDQADE